MRFDVTDLKLFVGIVEAGSITHGAAAMNMALGAASARVRGMEDVAGVKLVDRQRSGITVTPAGRALLQHSRIILRDRLGQEPTEAEVNEEALAIKARFQHLHKKDRPKATEDEIQQILRAYTTGNQVKSASLSGTPQN